MNSNGNLQADRTVSLTGTVSLNDKQLQRVSVEGLPAAVKATYEYNGQEGEATTSSDGSLCLWMEVQKEFAFQLLRGGVGHDPIWRLRCSSWLPM